VISDPDERFALHNRVRGRDEDSTVCTVRKPMFNFFPLLKRRFGLRERMYLFAHEISYKMKSNANRLHVNKKYVINNSANPALLIRQNGIEKRDVFGIVDFGNHKNTQRCFTHTKVNFFVFLRIRLPTLTISK
jgi:hypothetical protein